MVGGSVVAMDVGAVKGPVVAGEAGVGNEE